MAEVLKFPASPAERPEPDLGPAEEQKRATLKSRTALTELRVEKLKVTGKTYYTNDGAQPGLSVRVTAGGVKSYCFTKFRHQKFIQITLGKCDAMRLDAARQAVQKLHGDLAMGVDIGSGAQSSKDCACAKRDHAAGVRAVPHPQDAAAQHGDRLRVPVAAARPCRTEAQGRQGCDSGGHGSG